MEKINFTLHKPRRTQVIFIEEQEENKILFEYFGDFADKKEKLKNYEQTLKEIHQLLKNGFEIMAD